MAQSFSMWLIDSGRIDACTLGWAWDVFRSATNMDFDMLVRYDEVPEFLWYQDNFPTQFHRYLGVLDRDAWKIWLAHRRIFG